MEHQGTLVIDQGPIHPRFVLDHAKPIAQIHGAFL
jgi:hypothetical protein